jgi:hypothetical protein
MRIVHIERLRRTRILKVKRFTVRCRLCQGFGTHFKLEGEIKDVRWFVRWFNLKGLPVFNEKFKYRDTEKIRAAGGFAKLEDESIFGFARLFT